MADTQNARETERVEPVWDQDRTAGDETLPAGTNGGLRGISGSDWAIFGAIAAVSLATGIVNGLSAAQDATWRGESYDLGRRLFWEMSSVTVILLTVPLLLLAVRWVRQTPGLAIRAGIGASALVGFSTFHIIGMVWIRKLAVWLAGGYYDFHLSFATVLYEFRKDAVTCLLIGATVWLFDSRRDLKRASATGQNRSAAPQQSAAPDVIWLRDGASRIRVAPREILWVASAGNYIEYCLADGTQHLIRGTLAAAEAELSRFHIVRVHRTRLANLDRVSGVDLKPSGDFELTFDSGQALQGSRRYRSSVVALGDRTTSE
ncbi:LytTR family transcriptional regulator DNA-binding domain-containing protein [Bradyrhizobium sp. 186]|uniref:LytTR family DNA-binding domain-containing protein n=1 Tax=Bradyrhizobium sp. 186 TaxID=2782654 RepID=UPI0020006BED|nr:LytTR family DNA-binding domain-containing protein [Bradyrhizobium sp. 186]UPK39967.1 LytTR family transcriptional regulator DNA-binding domain-containing protein [Bradyrhizobium sp. 186]